MSITYLVVFRYFGCFWSSNSGETEQKVRMPNDALSKSVLSQLRSPARANHYRNPGEASSSVSLNREAGGITPSQPLDHHLMTSTPSHSITWSLDHSISSSLHLPRSQGGVPEAQFDQWHTRSQESSFQPIRCQWHIRSQGHDV